MKLSRLVTAVVLLLVVSMCAPAAVTIVSSGTPAAVILTKPSPGNVLTKAAQDFQLHIQLMSGATLPIDTVGHESSYPGKAFIYLGQSTATDAAGVYATSLTYEYYRVVTSGNVLYIVGKDGGTDDWTNMSGCWTGTMNGMYYVLGDVLGCRWLWPGSLGTYVPHASTVIVPDQNVTDGPMMEQRKYRIPRVGKCYLNGTDNYNGIKIIPADTATRTALSNEEYMWWRHQRMGSRREPDTGHSYNDWWDKYGAAHPEYFAVLPAGYTQPYPVVSGEKRVKLNDSSPVVWQAVVDEWIGQGKGNGLNACPNDSKGFCICDNCLAWDRPSQLPSVVFNSSSARLSDRMAQFWSHVANLVAPINPNCLVYGYAYDVYKYAPLEATVPANVALAYVPGAPTDTTLDGIQQTEDEAMGWVAHGCQNMYLRPNWFLSSHVGPEWPLTRCGEHFIRMTATGGFKGLDSDSSCSAYSCFGPEYYMIARLMADVTLTIPEIKAEWCSAFGSAAPKMQEYLQYWEDFIYAEADKGNTAILGWSTCVAAYDDTFTTAAFDGADAILSDAYGMLGPSEGDARARLDFMKMAVDHGRLTAKAISLVNSSAITSNPQCEAAMRALLAYRDANATSQGIWREWFIDREGYIAQMKTYWTYILSTPGYALTVNNGSGTGSYHSGAVVPVVADPPLTGDEFAAWTGDTSIVANINLSSTTVTMPAVAKVITATYRPSTGHFTLIVNSGSGDGSYVPNDVVTVVADAPASGYSFDKWIGDTASVANVNSATTTVTMPSSAVTITATYIITGQTYTLNVVNGSGGGTYLPGTVVAIVADAPGPDETFSQWTGDTQYVANLVSATTTVTMPAQAVNVTATYVSTYHLTVNSGTGEGDYIANTVVNIVAAAPQQGYQFSRWTGDTDHVANVLVSSTTVTMPTHATTVTATYVIASGDTFTESGGQVVMEAEHYSNTTPGTGSFVDEVWTLNTTTSGDSGDSMQILPNNALNAGDGSTAGPALNFKINFATTGVYYSLVRFPALGGQDDSINIGMDGAIFQSQLTATSSAWKWSKAPTTKTITTPGVHIFNIFMREDGVIVDKIILTTNASYTLVGTDTGPAESAHQSSGSYTLTVNSGTGSGSYSAGTVVNIAANAAPAGKTFDKWTGDTAGVASVTSASTTVTMPSSAVVITATYKDVLYALTVTSGTGSGSYTMGQVVAISANAAPAGKVFDKWTGDTANVANITSASTNVTMPATAVVLTATYKDILYTLTVTSGTGSGSYAMGQVVAIAASAAPAGKTFDKWTGDTAGVAGITSASTTVTMPASAVVLTATYKDALYTLTVFSGTGSGSYTMGQIVAISANTAPLGQTFDKWTGDTAGVANVTNASTTVTMPAGAVVLTATYKNVLYTLTVTSGTGSGSYTMGQVVAISASAAPAGKTFDKWTGDTAGVANAANASTTVTMPASAVNLTATYKDVLYTLTVTSGSGSGSYAMGQVVAIAASAAPAGKTFDKWTGDTAAVANANSASTSVTMPASAVNVTATYKDVQYALTVTSGTGSGSYTMGQVVAIAASAAPVGKTFDKWTGDTSAVANVNNASTSVTMPASAVNVTATYKDVLYTLTVTSGSGSGSYTMGQVVGITASAAPAGKTFDKWTGDTAAVANVGAASTSVTMPASAVNVTATYKDVLYTLTVTSGTGSGSYTMGQVVTISASAAPVGKTFDKWTGDTSSVANVNNASTSVTMPASAVNVMATYKDILYALTVTSGTGSGSYVMGQVVSIAASAAPTGKTFDKWTGDTAAVANVTAANTSVTMPSAAVNVTATYKDVLYSLTVNSGSGDGSYAMGSVVTITADAPAAGKMFDKWTGDTTGVANVNNASTTVTIPAGAVVVTATYKDVTYTLTVNSGSGSGSYTMGQVVAITAAAAPAGKTFDKWTGDTAAVANANSASTSVTMPASAINVTATYKDVLFALTVTSGTGSGSYTAGQVVAISASAAPAGKTFDKWTGDVAAIANVNSASTTVTMPAAAVAVTATYKDVLYTLVVNSGTGDGSYAMSAVVTITADAAPSGMTFDKWTGDTATIANTASATTTITMPAAAATVTATYKSSVEVGTGLLGEYYNDMTFTNLVLSRLDPTINFSWPTGTSPDPLVNTDNFSVRWTGWVKPPTTGTYTFYIAADDGEKLWVNNVLLVNDWSVHGSREKSASIALTAGVKYDIRIDYFENAKDASIKLSWAGPSVLKQIIPTSCLFPAAGAPPPPPPPVGDGTGLLGDYYSGTNFGTLLLSRLDPTINFTWPTGTSPDPLVPDDYFSVRWTGQVLAPYSGTYTFYVAADDGVKLWVNNVQLVSDWSNHSSREKSGSVTLVAGAKYDIKIEYYENQYDASIKLQWASPDIAKQIVPMIWLYPAGSAPPPPPPPPPPPAGTGTGLTGMYYNETNFTNWALTRIDPTINFVWPKGTSPDPLVGDDTFSVRWTGKVEAPYSGTYTFYMSSDDGNKLWVNGILLVNDWSTHSAREKSGSISLTAGQKYDIVIEYFENTADASVKMSWSCSDIAKQIVPMERLYPN